MMAAENAEEQSIMVMIDACAKGNIDKARYMIECDKVSACRQDDKTGKSPLMAAATTGQIEICKLLLEEGAPWNAIDRKGQCAGNYATDYHHWEIVNLLVDAGTQAELILGASIRLKEQLATNLKDIKRPTAPASAPNESKPQEDDDTQGAPVEHEPCSKPDYIQKHRLRYNEDKTALLDGDEDAVMMEWERPLMEAHASILMEPPGKRVMNIGFGMGIIDTALQNLQPALHIIVEAHPDVYAHMLQDKWDEKPNVRICFGKWQDEIPKLVREGIELDGIFYDTYAENFMDLEDFHTLTLPTLLSQPNGVYSFFNGLAPDNLFFHGVACQCVKLQLAHMKLDTEFLPCEIKVADEVWDGVRRKYWHGRDTYYLPVAKWNAEYLADIENKKQKGFKEVPKRTSKTNIEDGTVEDASKRSKMEKA